MLIITILYTYKFSVKKKKPTGLAGGSSQAGITLIVPANALRAYDGLTGRRLLATRKRVKIHC